MFLIRRNTIGHIFLRRKSLNSPRYSIFYSPFHCFTIINILLFTDLFTICNTLVHRKYTYYKKKINCQIIYMTVMLH